MSDSDFTKSVVSVAADADVVSSLNSAIPLHPYGCFVYFPPRSPPQSWVVGSDLDLPENVTVWFAPGASVQIARDVTMRIRGDILADLHQIFDVSQGGTVQLLGSLPAVYPEWWGTGNVSTGDTAALQAAIDAVSTGRMGSSGILPTIPVVLSGAYQISRTIVVNHSDDSMVGGPAGLLMKGARGGSDSPTAAIRALSGLDFGGPLLSILGPGGFTIEDVLFDGSAAATGCVEVVFQPDGQPDSNRFQVNSFARCTFRGSAGAALVAMVLVDPSDMVLLTGSTPSMAVFDACIFSPNESSFPAVNLTCPLSVHTQFNMCVFSGIASTMIYAAGVRFGLSGCDFFNQNRTQTIGGRSDFQATDILLDMAQTFSPFQALRLDLTKAYPKLPYILRPGDPAFTGDIPTFLTSLAGQQFQEVPFGRSPVTPIEYAELVTGVTGRAIDALLVGLERTTERTVVSADTQEVIGAPRVVAASDAGMDSEAIFQLLKAKTSSTG